jgi:hypothetical protein
MAVFRPMLRGRRCVPPNVGMIPMLISALLKITLSAASAMCDQLASAAEGQSVYRSDDRLRKGFDAPGHLVAGPHEMRDSFRRGPRSR